MPTHTMLNQAYYYSPDKTIEMNMNGEKNSLGRTTEMKGYGQKVSLDKATEVNGYRHKTSPDKMTGVNGYGDTDSPSRSRVNRSNKPRVISEKERSASLQDCHSSLQLNLMNKIQDFRHPNKRSVSFNGVSIMVDNILKSFNHVKCKFPELVEALETNNINKINKLVREDSVPLLTALFAAIENDKVSILNDLLSNGCDPEIICDDNGFTLLHAAAEHGALFCTELLLSKGMKPNVWDKQGNETAVHCAARSSSDKNTDIMALLLNNGGDINAGLDMDSGSVLHSAVRANNTEVVSYLVNNKAQTVPKTFSEAPLHLAAENNLFACAEVLLQANPGSVNALKGRDKRMTSLHIASNYGYAETCEVLLRFGADVTLKNSLKMTAVHLAAKLPNEPVLRLLLKYGCDVDSGLVNSQEDDEKMTPLLCCTASKGRGVAECMALLIQNGAEVDKQNKAGYTPLHIAAIDRKHNRVNLLIARDADLSIENEAGLSALHFINKKVPHCLKVFEERLDSGLKLESSSAEMGSKIKLDFSKISTSVKNMQKKDIAIFKDLIQSPQVPILKHPLAESFLHLKWNQIKFLYYFCVLFCHFVWSSIYSIYAILVFSTLCAPPDISSRFDPSASVTCNFHDSQNIHVVNIALLSWIFLIFFSFVYLIKEISKIVSHTSQYLKNWESYLSTMILLTVPMISFTSDPFQQDNKVILYRWQFHVASIGCFLTWLQMMFSLGKVPRFGKYIQMFKKVAKGVLNFLFSFLFLLLAFASAFMILFRDQPSFANVLGTCVKVMMMMLGEVEYEDLYYPQAQTFNLSQNGTTEIIVENLGQQFPVTTHFFVLLFIFLVSIIVMNLLVGLAVSDIQGLQKSAKLHRLVQQVELINMMENIPFSPLFSYLPEQLQRFLRYKLKGLQRHYNYIYTIKPFDPNDKTLPESLKKSLYDNIARRQSKSREDSQEKDIQDIKDQLRKVLSLLRGNSDTDHNMPSMTMSTSSSRASIVSSMSQSLLVDDDIDSDNENGNYDSYSSKLPSISEEGGIGYRRIKRKDSNLSTLTTTTSGASTDYESDTPDYPTQGKKDSIL